MRFALFGTLLLAHVGCFDVASGPSPIRYRTDRPLELPPSADQSVSDSFETPRSTELASSLLAPPSERRTCRETLADAGINFRDASPSATIADPIRLGPVIGSVTFRHHNDPRPRRMWVDCHFAQRLVRAAVLLAHRGVREVIHVGTYEPKCVGGGSPDARPGCVLSPHALGMAIDVVALVREHDTVEIARDFVRRSDATPTCQTPAVGERDAFLKELVCALDGTFSVLLTPNWDVAHRSHFHFALHPPARAPWANGVDPVQRTE